MRISSDVGRGPRLIKAGGDPAPANHLGSGQQGGGRCNDHAGVVCVVGFVLLIVSMVLTTLRKLLESTRL
jgi:hypothetical protein